MPWFANIPAANDFISVSQGQIQDNFQALDAWSQVDLSPIDSAAALNGYHYKTTFAPQNAPLATPTFPPGYPGMYAKTPTDALPKPQTGFNEIYLQLNNATNSLIPFTAGLFRGTNVGNDGYFYLPNGALVKYGTILVPASSPSYTYTYTVDGNLYPVFGNVAGIGNPVVFLTPFVNIADLGVPSSVSAAVVQSELTSFNYVLRDQGGTSVGGPREIFFVAIGTPA